ncbi:MAG TPA: ABC transporter permease, partial [Bacteroidales bacterium]|nr:ABC transporter permease [Bacteroidales bacterium]
VAVNKLRTFLSLFGITIGIFSIISVFTVFDWMENSIKDSIATLGDNTVYIQKMPWSFDPNIPWWDMIRWPAPSMEEYDNITRKSKVAGIICYNAYAGRTVKYKANSLTNNYITATTSDYDKLRTFDIDKGRYISLAEFNSGTAVAVIGSGIEEKLFGQNISAVGKEITIDGFKTTVIGVIKKEGAGGIVDDGMDEDIIVPVNYGKKFMNLRSRWIDSNIMVKGKPNVSVEELSEEMTMILRNARRLRPNEITNFSINKASMLVQGFKPVFRGINIAGWIIGGFSILVGGFGIANIMFVSVRERTSIIGIQMALGAKRRFILAQFLIESVLLSILGGLLGLLLVFIGTVIVNLQMDTTIYLTAANILLAIGISAMIGIIAGYAPASSASKMNPVEAIGYSF